MADVSKASSRFADSLKDVGKIAGGVISGLIGFNILSEIKQLAVDSARAFMEFEQASVRLAALAREAGENTQFLAQVLRAEASAAAREFGVTGQEALSALESLVKAGLSGRDAVQALGQVIALAKVEGVDFATAANAVVQVMAQFGLTGSEAARAVDTLVNASRTGIGTAVDFAKGLANAGSVARQLGLSIEDTTTWLVALEKTMGSAQEAGTHLNRFLLELYEIAGKLGVPIRDAAGAMRDTNAIILDVIAVVREGGLSFADLQDKLRGVDARALKTVLTLAQMEGSFEELRAKVGQAGTALEAFGAASDTLAGRMQKMAADVERMQRSIGEGFATIGTMLGSVFLPFVEYAMGAWTDIIATATGNVAAQIQGEIQAWLAYQEIIGDVNKETLEFAANWIAAHIEAGNISVQEGLKIAENLGVMSDKLREVAGISKKTAEGLREVGAKSAEMGKNIVTANGVVEMLASKFRLSGQQVAELINRMTGLNITYDQHADLVAKLTSELGLTEQQARQLIDALIKEGEAQKQAAEATKQHEEAVKRATEALNRNIETLMNFGKVQGPLTSTINGIRDAMNTLGDTLSTDLKNKLDEALRYFEDVNNKLITLETNLKQVKAAADVAGIGISYYNTLTSISSALIVDETLALDAKIKKLQEEIKTLEERKKQIPSYADSIQQQIDMLKQELIALQQEKSQLQQSIALTDEQVATQARLKAIQDTLSFTTQQLSLMQTGLQLAMMGATETGGMFMNAILALTDAQMDGIVTEEEMKNVLQQLGVTFDETGRPVMNLKGFLEKFKQEVLENINKVNEFRNTLQSLHGMTVHTYHIHHQITVTEGGGGGGGEIVHQTGGRFFESYQRGTAFVPFTGPAILHRGEMVIPRDIADLIREGRGGRQITIVNNINTPPNSNPDEIARIVSREIVRRVRVL